VTSHIASQRAKERPNLEQTFFGRDPPQFVFTTSIKTDRVQYLKLYLKPLVESQNQYGFN